MHTASRRRALTPRGAALSLLSAAALLAAADRPARAQIAQAEPEYTGTDRVEQWRGKRILVVTPHPDVDTFTSGGTLALLARGGNDIRILIYTSDNAGSSDPEMTHERLAAIRRDEEEGACRILGIPADHITWLGYDDGMLEYVDRRELTKQVAREIRRIRPDAMFFIDPGAPYEQYHKSDHRSGAFITADAIRAARWRLYFPDLEQAGFKAYDVPVVFLFYSAQPNYTVDITAVAELKAKAAAAHVSQFEPLTEHYLESAITDEHRAQLAASLLARTAKENDRYVERFRRSEAY